jgi:hypothetical protein
LRIRIRMDTLYFWKLNPDPHWSESLNPDPHYSKYSEALGAQNKAVDSRGRSQ